jgi:small subunit ribosomal protein S6e
MAFKINISTKDGKTYKLEAEAPGLKQKKLGDVVQGQEVSPDLAGYELEITGASDKAGFTAMGDVEGMGLKKVLLDYGKGMHQRPKGDKKVGKKPLGLRLRKTVRGKVISDAISQINTKVLKEGGKKLSEIFADQNKAAEAPAAEEKPAEEAKPAEETKTKEKPAEVKEPAEEKPSQEPKEAPPTEADPEEEPKENPKKVEEKAKPDEEPKQ